MSQQASIEQPSQLRSHLIELVRSTPMLMGALRAARVVDPPDWLIGGGVIRDLVWDYLHDPFQLLTPKDVDLAFFDSTMLGEEREQSILNALRAQAPDVPWDVKNQAAVHLWYPQVFGIEVEPLTSSADGVGTWPETATAVAVKLHADDSVDVISPYGLEDLFGLICRRNPRRVTVEEYRQRLRSKRIGTRWPRLRVVQ